MSKNAWFHRSWPLFFPEILPAAFFVLISPIWEIQLIGRGQIAAALVLPLGVITGTLLFYRGIKEKLRWIAYAAMVVILLTALAAHALGR
jgi:hypothetical protein